MSEPKLDIKEETSAKKTRSLPKRAKVEQSVPKKKKLKIDAEKTAEKAQHLRFGKAELTPEGNLTLVDDYQTNYSDGSGQQFITLVSKSGNTFYLVIDRNAKGQQTVHFMNLVDEADLLALMEEEDVNAYTAEKEAAAQAELERKQAQEDAKKAEEEAAASGTEQPKENKITKYAATFLGVIALLALAAGGGFYAFMKQKQRKKAEKEALDPDAN